MEKVILEATFPFEFWPDTGKFVAQAEYEVPEHEVSGMIGVELNKPTFVVIMWDGIRYDSIAAIIQYSEDEEIEPSDLLLIGNLSFYGLIEDTGEPFMIMMQGNNLYIVANQEGATHTFSILVSNDSGEPVGRWDSMFYFKMLREYLEHLKNRRYAPPTTTSK